MIEISYWKLQRNKLYTDSVLVYAPDLLKDDPEIVMHAVKNNGLELQHASKRLQNDMTIVNRGSVTMGTFLRVCQR